MSEQKLRHLGIICDGNRRWAKENGLTALEGHSRGFKKAEVILDALRGTEVEYVSFFLFSTENWDRAKDEVAHLMGLARMEITNLVKKANKENLRLVIMGRPEKVEPKLWQELMAVEEKTAKNTGRTVAFCFNYGGRWEIVDAANRAIATGKELQEPADLEQYLYRPEVPACDLIVRTSGEQRISGFQLWRAAYAEFLFLDKHFPAIEPADIAAIIEEYHRRQRRFGK